LIPPNPTLDLRDVICGSGKFQLKGEDFYAIRQRFSVSDATSSFRQPFLPFAADTDIAGKKAAYNITSSRIVQDLKSDKYPVLTEFYKKMIKFSDEDLEWQQSLWKERNMNFPDWFAPYHKEHSSACLRLNHIQGRGCSEGASCRFKHVCILCGEDTHGAFQRKEGSNVFRCRFQRMFMKELSASGYTEHELFEAIAAEKVRDGLANSVLKHASTPHVGHDGVMMARVGGGAAAKSSRLEDGGMDSHELRLMLIDDGEASKTSLQRALKAPEADFCDRVEAALLAEPNRTLSMSDLGCIVRNPYGNAATVRKSNGRTNKIILEEDPKKRFVFSVSEDSVSLLGRAPMA